MRTKKTCGCPEVRNFALRYVEHGYSVIPLRLDGSKGPALNSWKEYTKRLPTSHEINEWFSDPVGIGLVCGPVSAGLEIIDFDMHQLIWPLLAMLPKELGNQLAKYETPGGWHVA